MKNKAHRKMLAVNSAAAKKGLRQQQQNVKKQWTGQGRSGSERRLLKVKQLRRIEEPDGNVLEGYSNCMMS